MKIVWQQPVKGKHRMCVDGSMTVRIYNVWCACIYVDADVRMHVWGHTYMTSKPLNSSTDPRHPHYFWCFDRGSPLDTYCCKRHTNVFSLGNPSRCASARRPWTPPGMLHTCPGLAFPQWRIFFFFIHPVFSHRLWIWIWIRTRKGVLLCMCMAPV